MIYLLVYLAIVNLITFFLFWNDKKKSKKTGQRISEKTLLGFSAIGGSLGGIFGMNNFHHKTRHPKFYIGLPCILVFQIGISVFIYWKFF